MRVDASAISLHTVEPEVSVVSNDRSLFPAALVALGLLLPSPAAAALLTDLTVFSTNSDGHAYYSLIWNTQGAPDDRYNL